MVSYYLHRDIEVQATKTGFLDSLQSDHLSELSDQVFQPPDISLHNADVFVKFVRRFFDGPRSLRALITQHKYVLSSLQCVSRHQRAVTALLSL